MAETWCVQVGTNSSLVIEISKHVHVVAGRTTRWTRQAGSSNWIAPKTLAPPVSAASTDAHGASAG
eukprot:9922347-Alexandrium_andersonii.AAC.1